MVSIALIQFHISPEPDANLRRAVEFVESAARRGARIVCLPELFRTRYFPQSEDPRNFELAEPLDGATLVMMSAVAQRLGVTLVVPFFEQRAPGVYHNSLVVIDADGERIGHYRKLHIPDDPHFYEKYYFAPGDLGYSVAPLRLRSGTPLRLGAESGPDPLAEGEGESVRIGSLICWDQWYPEAARLTALAGAQIILYPTAIGWHESELPAVREEQLDAWVTMQRAHAIANGVFVAAANRVGVEGELTFWGTSLVINPAGKIIARAGVEAEEILLAECDLAQIAEQRHGWPFLRDRRVDAYGGLLQRMLD